VGIIGCISDYSNSFLLEFKNLIDQPIRATGPNGEGIKKMTVKYSIIKEFFGFREKEIFGLAKGKEAFG
jgi:hypothetical protein